MAAVYGRNAVLDTSWIAKNNSTTDINTSLYKIQNVLVILKQPYDEN